MTRSMTRGVPTKWWGLPSGEYLCHGAQVPTVPAMYGGTPGISSTITIARTRDFESEDMEICPRPISVVVVAPSPMVGCHP